MRICTLFPSATEIVFALGAGDAIVGVSHECDFPPAALSLPRLTRTRIPEGLTSAEIDRLVSMTLETAGSLYEIDRALMERLKPDLVITQALCDVCAVSANQLAEAIACLPRKPRMIELNASSLEDVFRDIGVVAEEIGSRDEGKALLAALRARVERVAKRTAELPDKPRVLCLEWLEPPYCGGHWMKDLVELAGGEDALAVRNRPSRRIEWQAVFDFAPEIIVLTCCGYDLERCSQEAQRLPSLPGARQLPALRDGRIYATDSSAYFARPGPRLVDSLEILAHIIHPEIFSAPELDRGFRRIEVVPPARLARA